MAPVFKSTKYVSVVPKTSTIVPCRYKHGPQFLLTVSWEDIRRNTPWKCLTNKLLCTWLAYFSTLSTHMPRKLCVSKYIFHLIVHIFHKDTYIFHISQRQITLLWLISRTTYVACFPSLTNHSLFVVLSSMLYNRNYCHWLWFLWHGGGEQQACDDQWYIDKGRHTYASITIYF